MHGFTDKELARFVYAEKTSRFSYYHLEMMKFLSLLELLDDLRGKRILDIGCGNGLVLRFLDPANTIFAIDVRDQSEYYTENKNITFVRIDPDKPYPFEDESFDVILCNQVLEHVPDVDLVLREMKRLLKKEGFIQISVPNTILNLYTIAIGIPVQIIRLFYKPDDEQKKRNAEIITAQSPEKVRLAKRFKQALFNYVAQADYSYREHRHYKSYAGWQKIFRRHFSINSTDPISLFHGASMLCPKNFREIYTLEKKFVKKWWANPLSAISSFILTHR